MFRKSFHLFGLLLITLLIMGACQPVQPLPETKSVAAASAQTTLEQANQAVVQRFYEEVVNQKKLDALNELFDTKGIVDHDLDFGAQGGDLGGVLTGLPDVKATVSLWLVEEDLVTAVVTFQGTHQGELLGIAPTGELVTFSLIDIWRVQNGRLTDIWHNVPNSDILEQIQGEPTGETDAEAANQAVVQRFYDEVFTQKKMEVLGEIFDANLVIHDLDVGGELGGATLLEDTLTAFPDVKATINLWVVEGDLVTVYVTYVGTHQAEFLGVAPTGKIVTWSIIDIMRVQNSKIAELWHDVPNGDILEQIQPEASSTMTMAEQAVFTGTVEAQETYIITAPTMLVDTTGSGESAELGSFSVAWEFTVNLDTGSGIGSAHFTAANGDRLDTTSLGQGDPTETADVSRVVEQHTITGGKGRYAGATGSFTLDRLVNTATGVTAGSFEGSIVLQKVK